MQTFWKIIKKRCIKEKHPQSTANINFSTCATLRGHLSTSWALVVHCYRPRHCMNYLQCKITASCEKIITQDTGYILIQKTLPIGQITNTFERIFTGSWRDLKTDERQWPVAGDCFPFLGLHRQLHARFQERLSNLPELDKIWRHAMHVQFKSIYIYI